MASWLYLRTWAWSVLDEAGPAAETGRAATSSRWWTARRPECFSHDLGLKKCRMITMHQGKVIVSVSHSTTDIILALHSVASGSILAVLNNFSYYVAEIY